MGEAVLLLKYCTLNKNALFLLSLSAKKMKQGIANRSKRTIINPLFL